MPKVSVIIPTYNNAHLLVRAVTSILDQTFQDFEILIIDDASTDDTGNVVAGFHDERIRCIRNDHNMGEAGSRNAGISEAKGQYIAFLDSDDEAMPERLQKQVTVLNDSMDEVGIVYTDMLRINSKLSSRYLRSPDLEASDGDIHKKILGYGAFKIGIGTAMIRKKCFDIVGGFQEGLSYYVDMEFFVRLSRSFYFHHLREPLIKYYETAGEHQRNIKVRVDSCQFILEKYFDEIKKDKRILARHYRKIATLLMGGDPARAREYAIKALKVYPAEIVCVIVLILSFSGKKCCNFLSNKLNK